MYVLPSAKYVIERSIKNDAVLLMQFFPLILTLRVNLKREVCPVTFFFWKLIFFFCFFYHDACRKSGTNISTYSHTSWRTDAAYHLLSYTYSPEGGKWQDKGGKISDLRKKGDFLKCYLHNFKSYRYSITLELFETQCLKKITPKMSHFLFQISFLAFTFHILFVFILMFSNEGCDILKLLFATCSKRRYLWVEVIWK